MPLLDNKREGPADATHRLHLHLFLSWSWVCDSMCLCVWTFDYCVFNIIWLRFYSRFGVLL